MGLHWVREVLGKRVPYLAWVPWVALEALPEPFGLGDTAWASQAEALHRQRYGVSLRP